MAARVYAHLDIYTSVQSLSLCAWVKAFRVSRSLAPKDCSALSAADCAAAGGPCSSHLCDSAKRQRSPTCFEATSLIDIHTSPYSIHMP